MSNECSKYRELFVFQDEQNFLEHIKHCESCKSEHAEQLAVSMLLRQSAVEIKKRNKRVRLSKIAASLAIIGISAFIITTSHFPSNPYNVISEKETSVIAQLGLPADDYGLLTVE